MSLAPMLSTGGHFVRRDSAETDDSTISSGLTTPADEEALHPFDQIVLPVDCEGTVNDSLHAFSFSKTHAVATPKARSLSKAVAKAKQFAQSLGKSHNKSVKKTAVPPPSLPTPAAIRSYIDYNLPVVPLHEDLPFEDICGRPRRTTIFNLPNEDIEPAIAKGVVQDSMTEPSMKSTATMSTIDTSSGIVSGGITGEDTKESSVGDHSAEERSGSIELSQRSEEMSAPWYDIDQLPLEWPKNPVTLLAKILGFLPWCIAVGGAIMLCPSQLELVAFQTGYQPSLTGIRRFAYCAECAMQHVAIFVGFVAIVCWWSSALGTTLLVGAIMAGFCLAWGDFVLDRTVPLGNDDRQTIYLVFTNFGLQGDSVVFRKTADGYFALEKSLHDDVGVGEERLVE